MERFMSLLKRYPLPIAGAVLAVVIVVWYLSSDSEASGDSVSRITSFGPDPTSVMANRDVNIAEKQMNAAAAANAAALEGLEIQGKYSVALAGIDAVSYERTLNTTKSISEIEAARDVDLVKAGGAAQATIAGIVTGAQTQQTQIVTGASVQQSQINANAATSLATISADLQRARDAAAAETARINAGANVYIAQMQESTEARRIDATREFALFPGITDAIWGIQPPDTTNIISGMPALNFNQGN